MYLWWLAGSGIIKQPFHDQLQGETMGEKALLGVGGGATGNELMLYIVNPGRISHMHIWKQPPAPIP